MMMSSVVSGLGIIPKASQTKFHSDHEIKSGSFLKSNTKTGKNKKVRKKCSGLQNGAIRKLKIGAGFKYYKSGKEGLQIGAALGVSNRDKKITNRGRVFKSRGRYFKSGQRLQMGAEQLPKI